MGKNVFELNAPNDEGIFTRDGKVPGFAGDVGRIPELHIPDERRTAGSPINGRRARMFLERAREELQAGRIACACPAATLIGEGLKGPGVRCGIEREPIFLFDNPSSLLNLCTKPTTEPGGGYSRCPTWQAEVDKREVAPLVPEELEGI